MGGAEAIGQGEARQPHKANNAERRRSKCRRQGGQYQERLLSGLVHPR